jgi:hypothetical protein
MLVMAPIFGQGENCNCKSERVPAYEKRLTGKIFHNKLVGKNEQFFAYWTRGDIYLTDNSIVKDKNLRYNGLIDELLWMRDSDYKIALLDRNTIERFVLYMPDNKGTVAFVKVDQKDPKHSENNDMFLQLLADGEVKLFKKIEVTDYPVQGVVIRKDIFYLYKNNYYYRLKPGRAFLFHLFTPDKKTIKHIVRSNNLAVKKEADLIKAINLYNQQDAVKR